MPRLRSVSSTRGVTAGSGPLSNDNVRSNTKTLPQVAGCMALAGMFLPGPRAAPRPVLPVRVLRSIPLISLLDVRIVSKTRHAPAYEVRWALLVETHGL